MLELTGVLGMKERVNQLLWGGTLEILQWCRAEGCSWDEGTCAAAAGGGRLEVLQWCRADWCPWDEGTCVVRGI